MDYLKTFIRWRGRIGRGASVAVTSAMLAGCATATQTPELCATPQAQRDPKCADQAKKTKAAEAAPAGRVQISGNRSADSGSDY